MKKIYIGYSLVVVLFVGLFLFLNQTDEYTVMVDRGIIELENDLADLNNEILAGTLTSESAIETKIRLIKKIEAISTSIERAQQDSGLTEAQRNQLLNALEKLKKILFDYQETLVAVDNKAGTTAKVNGSNSNSGDFRTLTEIVIDIVTETEESISEGEVSVDEEVISIEEMFEVESESENGFGDEGEVVVDEENTTQPENETGTATEEGDSQSTTVDEVPASEDVSPEENSPETSPSQVNLDGQEETTE